MTFLTGTRRHRVQIARFFRTQIGSWRSLGIGLVVGKRLYRIRRRCDGQRALEAIAKLFMVIERAVARELVDYAPSPGACGVGDCARLLTTLGDPGETFGPRIDRIPQARPPCGVGGRAPRIKKIPFPAPSKCPIDLFGPVANRTILKRLHERSGLLVSLHAASLSFSRPSHDLPQL